MNCGKECDYDRYKTCVYIDTTFCPMLKKRSRLGKFLSRAFPSPYRDNGSELSDSHNKRPER